MEGELRRLPQFAGEGAERTGWRIEEALQCFDSISEAGVRGLRAATCGGELCNECGVFPRGFDFSHGGGGAQYANAGGGALCLGPKAQRWTPVRITRRADGARRSTHGAWPSAVRQGQRFGEREAAAERFQRAQPAAQVAALTGTERVERQERGAECGERALGVTPEAGEGRLRGHVCAKYRRISMGAD